jgi:hypothetical protein
MSKEIVKVEMNWPGREKETMTIGPFFRKVRKNAIQVSRKGNLIIITVGKDLRGKWGKLIADKGDSSNSDREHYEERAIHSNEVNF